MGEHYPSVEPGVEQKELQSLDKTQSPAETEPDNATTSSPRKMNSLSWTVLLIAILFSYFLFAFDNTVVANIRPQIIYSLGEVDKLPMLSTGYALAATSSNLLWGQLYRSFSIKFLYLVAVLIFEVGSAVCGSAQNMNSLIVGRALCGFGGAGMYLGTITIITALSTPQERPKYLGFLGITYAAGSLLGPIIGGAFSDSVSWRWAFYLCIFIGGAAAPMYLLLLPRLRLRPDEGLVKGILSIDWFGFIIVAGAVTALVMTLSLGGSTWAWNGGKIVGLIVCTGCLWILFVAQQAVCLLTTREARLFPVQMLRSWEMCILFAQTAASIGSVLLTFYFVPIYFQFVRDKSALAAGVRLLPAIGTFAVATIINGVVMGKVPLYMPWYLVGSTLLMVGGILLHFINFTSTTSYILGSSVLVSFGGGLYAQTSFTVAQAKAGPKAVGAATAFIGFAQLGGTNLCLTISNSIFLNQATDKIAATLPGSNKSDIVPAVSGAGSSLFQSLSADARESVLIQITAAIRQVFYMVVAAGALSMFLSILLKRERLHHK